MSDTIRETCLRLAEDRGLDIMPAVRCALRMAADEIERLAAAAEAGGWRDISTAPDLDRVMVCGWNPPHKRVSGYWWWYEDAVSEGRAIEHPTALYWCPVVLPAFPQPPQPQEQVR